jgi:uncharacterized protein DUF4158
MSPLVQFPIAVSSVRHSRAGFESVPNDLSKVELLRYFTYSENDLKEINLCRGANNRIGFALLLSGVRLTGRFPHDEEAEEDRLLYVAATRAAEELVIARCERMDQQVVAL